MVSSPMENGLIYDIKLSSIGPADVTDSDSIYEPKGIDLAMKLHYLKGIYYFKSPAFEGLTTLVIKEPMFIWLNKYPMTCGRFRRDESGRAYIKCNDCGMRFMEAKCDKTLDEWLEVKDATLEKNLVPSQVIGPELGFSPLVFIQLTKFKCGGMAMGISWAHVLGDPFSVSEFVNSLGRVVAGHELGQPAKLTQTHIKQTTPIIPSKLMNDPLSIKRVDPIGDNWAYVSKSKMGLFSFIVTSTHLKTPKGLNSLSFETLSSIIWQCIARIRGEDRAPNIVTICKKGVEKEDERGTLKNSQVISVVKTNSPVTTIDASKLALMLKNDASDETWTIDMTIEKYNGLVDFIVYGVYLTFVNLEEARFFEFEYRGQKPISVTYMIDGVGDEGAILVLPGPRDGNSDQGKKVVAILPEDEIDELKSELKKEGLMA